MSLIEIILEATMTSARIMGLVLVIVVPAITIFEILLRKKILNKISKKFSRVMGWFDLPGSAAFPLIAGLMMGIAYGAGVLYGYQQKKILKTRDFNIISTILSLWHAIIEDTILFTIFGASFIWVFGVRIVIMLIVVKFLLILGKAVPRLDFFGKGK